MIGNYIFPGTDTVKSFQALMPKRPDHSLLYRVTLGVSSRKRKMEGLLWLAVQLFENLRRADSFRSIVFAVFDKEKADTGKGEGDTGI